MPSVNGDYVDVVCLLKDTKACVSLAACEWRTKLQAVETLETTVQEERIPSRKRLEK